MSWESFDDSFGTVAEYWVKIEQAKAARAAAENEADYIALAEARQDVVEDVSVTTATTEDIRAYLNQNNSLAGVSNNTLLAVAGGLVLLLVAIRK